MGWRELSSIKKGLIIGGIIGIVIAIVNIFLAGMVGMIFLYLFFIPGVLDFVNNSIFNCSGESCWGPMIVLGCISILIHTTIIGALIGWIVGKIKRK